MSYIPKSREYFDQPYWAGRLRNYYWVIRNEGRNKTKRRMYYRLVAAEKLRLTPVTVYVTVDGRKLQYSNRKKRKTNLHNFITIYADLKNQFDLSVISQNA